MAAVRKFRPLTRHATRMAMATDRVGAPHVGSVVPVIAKRALNTDTAPVLYSAHARVVGARTG